MRSPSASNLASTKALVGVAGDELADLLENAFSIPEFEPAEPALTEPDDVLILDDAMEVSEPEPAPGLVHLAYAEAEPEDSRFTPGDDELGSEADLPEPDDVLVLDDTMEVAEPADVAGLDPAIHEPDAEPDGTQDPRIKSGGDELGSEADLPEPDDVLVLDDAMEVPEPEPADPAIHVPDAEPDGTQDPRIMSGSDELGTEADLAEPDDVLVLDDAMEAEAGCLAGATVELDDAFLAVLPPYEPPDEADDSLVEPEPEPEPESPQPEPTPEFMPNAADVAQMVAAQLAAHGIAAEDSGDYSLPERRDILVQLLAEPPPPHDFPALDMLYGCWPKNTARSASRALLAVALNLSSRFGLPGRLPMATSKAWRMLDSELFETDLAQLLLGIGEFISGWQREQSTFLILEFGEIELIEYLFESLPPSRYMDLLKTVMDFKVLSNRRMGLLRRIPNRLKKQVQTMLPERRDEALVLLAHSKALLEKLAQPPGFPPLLETAERMLEEVDKLMKQTAGAGQPAPPATQGPGGGQALGKIG